MEIIDLDEVFGTGNYSDRERRPVLNNRNDKSDNISKKFFIEIAKFVMRVAVVVACAFLIVTFVGQRT